MKIKGYDAKRSRIHGWRRGDPTTDLDGDGKPVQSNYIVIVAMRKCRVYECKGENECGRKRAHTHYDPKGVAQAHQLNYGGTYYGYTEWYPMTAADRRTVIHWRRKVFFVWQRQVYTATTNQKEITGWVKKRLFEQGKIITNGNTILKV